MFKHTKSALKKIGDDITKIWNFTNYSLISLSLIFLIIMLSFSVGETFVNVILLILTVFTLVITILCNKKFLTKKEKKEHKVKLYKIKHAIKFSKILTKAYSLGIVLYSMYFANAYISPFSIIFTTLMLIMWLASVVFELFILFFNKEKELFMSSLEKDFAWAINTKNFAEKTTSQVKETVESVKNSVVGFFKTRDAEKSNSEEK